MSAKYKQVGGGHYKDMPIQPVEFITKNKLGFLEGCVIKRMCRWQSKDGLKDLRKAIHEIELLIEAEFEAPPEALCSAEVAEPELPEEWPQRQCTCQPGRVPLCHCPPDRPLDAQNRAPMPNSNILPIAVPEGQDWPSYAPNGCRVLAWRPRNPGDPGTHLYGWVEIGFMWDGALVRYDAEG